MSPRNLVLAAAAVYGLQPIAASHAPASAQNGATIRGQVVDARTKAPLAGARVRLSGASQRGPVVTDDGGVFEFRGLPAGIYSFLVERSGYLSASWPNTSRWIRRRDDPVRLSAADHPHNVTLALERSGVVAGRVTTATGHALSGAQVTLIGLAAPNYTRTGTTNDVGDYRFGDLPPGRYVLRAQSPALTNDPPDTSFSGPLPTYYPGTLQRSEAHALVVGRSDEVTEANLRLIEGPLAVLDVAVTHTDGRRADSSTLIVMTVTEPPVSAIVRIRNGFQTMKLPPGEYTLEAQARSARQAGDRSSSDDSPGTARVRLNAAERQAVTVVIGLHATAWGRVVFDGDSPPPPAAAGSRVPMFASNGQPCRYGPPRVASDWSFTIDGLAGMCRSAATAPLSARWVLTSVILDGREVLDENVWFEAGRHYEDVRIVMSDRRSQVRVRVQEADGAPTGEYAAVAFPVQRERWRNPDRYIGAAAPLPPSVLGTPDPSGTGGEPGRSLRFIGLPPGDYYLVALDDIEYYATRDPAVLEQLARRATRVIVPERDLIEVALQRYVLSDVIK